MAAVPAKNRNPPSISTCGSMTPSTYEIGVDESGEDHPVDYVGMTADGKKVFFTTSRPADRRRH